MAAEVLAIIGSRLGGKAAMAAWQFIDDTAEVVFVERRQWEAALDLVLSRDGRVSMADASAVVLMRESGLRRIASFDEGFDGFGGIVRLH